MLLHGTIFTDVHTYTPVLKKTQNSYGIFLYIPYETNEITNKTIGYVLVGFLLFETWTCFDATTYLNRLMVGFESIYIYQVKYPTHREKYIRFDVSQH